MPNHVESKQCLIADDVRASRELLATWLSEFAFDCSLFADGATAWESIKRNPPDLIITDIEMPDCCGLELLQRVRQDPDPAVNKTPVLVVTSLYDGQLPNQVQQLGGNALLVKPLNKQATISIAREVLVVGLSQRELIISDPNDSIRETGRISPTLRRLLRLVGKDEHR